MITLGGVEISNNMYLDGLEQFDPLEVEQVRSIDGLSFARIYPNEGGRVLSLGTTQTGKIQGIWFQQTIDEIKIFQALKQPVVLDYHGDIYNVLIVSTKDMQQLFQNEIKGPCKKYIGKIELLEVSL